MPCILLDKDLGSVARVSTPMEKESCESLCTRNAYPGVCLVCTFSLGC
jgi:hypothetical protein